MTMQVLIFFVTIFAGIIIVQGKNLPRDPKWVRIPIGNSRTIIVNANQDFSDIIVNDSNVKFYYSSRNTSQMLLTVDTANNINNTDFNCKRRTMFIIHGWKDDATALINKLLTPALLQADDWNIFVTDWSDIASLNYIEAMEGVGGVGNVIAKFINLLSDLVNLSLDRLTLTGHSMGAHVAGRAGHALNGDVRVIIGLDPAGPIFDEEDILDSLNPTNGIYVQVIHSGGGIQGTTKQRGDADFYPNGGDFQPGCEEDFVGSCAHQRANYYFAESITLNDFTALYCPNYDSYKSGSCNNHDQAKMGGNILNLKANGTFYLDTNSESPFGKG